MATAKDYYLQGCKNWAGKITETEIDATKVITIPARIHHIKVLSTQTLPIVKSKGIVQLSTRMLLAKASVCITNKIKV